MKLRHLRIERFRGIRELDWFLEGDFLCLVGPGDSCKSTMLDAIELVLSPRWNPVFDDGDFYQGDHSQPIVIEATLGGLPRRLLSDDRFGLRLRGYSASARTIHDEPEEGDEEVATLRLRVDDSLEPTWHVASARDPEGVPFSAKEREKLGVTRLGAVVDRHLTWTKGSALAALTGDANEHGRVLAEALRQARKLVDPARLPTMSAAAVRVKEFAKKLGIVPRHRFEPRLDAGGPNANTLALHDDLVPVRRSGLGTRRLITLAIQRESTRGNGVVLIDEIEHGLEPFRLRRLLNDLLSAHAMPKEGEEQAAGLVFTTHSPVTLGQLRAEHLRVVRASSDGTVRVVKPGDALQGSLVTHAEAILSRKVIVCEGPTEMGLVMGLDEVWSKDGEPFAVRGVGLANGGGASKVAAAALDFRTLGYETLVVADSDKPLEKTEEELSAEGVATILWAGGLCTEQRLFLDLPWDQVASAVELAIEAGLPVHDQLSAIMKGPLDLGPSPSSWREHVEEVSLRHALGDAARSKNFPWFKSVRGGILLGRLVAEGVGAAPSTDVAKKVAQLRSWVFS